MKDFKKYYIIPAQPEELYAALTFEPTIRLWTGDLVEMGTEPGSEFSLWSGNITGKNLEFEPGRKLVQEWYFGEREEKSIVTIILHPDKRGTSMEVRQTNIPDEDFEDLVDGWDSMYAGGLIEFYGDED